MTISATDLTGANSSIPGVVKRFRVTGMAAGANTVPVGTGQTNLVGPGFDNTYPSAGLVGGVIIVPIGAAAQVGFIYWDPALSTYTSVKIWVEASGTVVSCDLYVW
jgi:hypothetical protein